MRIGLTGGAATIDGIVRQAEEAERDGFHALWYASAVAGDPLAAMAVAGRATTAIELGTAVVQTYPCHPVLQASRAASVPYAMGRPGFTLGIGPSHRPYVEGALGLSYEAVGAATEEYLRILTALLRGEQADLTGEHWSAHASAPAGLPPGGVPVLLAALGPRLLRAAGEYAEGVVLWMATGEAIDAHIAPRLYKAAASAGRPAPRIVAGLPVAVHHEPDEASTAAAATAVAYDGLPNYRRILEIGGKTSPAEAAVIGDEDSVRGQLAALADAGATDLWAHIVAVGPDRDSRRVSAHRTRRLLAELAARG
ncbi:TIGR03564 family F420-dependent LLM class oxidoreductase [Streptomyces sp. NBC_01373]|uniref:TIGR03564 family F420-dependent LLM class oxidoreductase n=1 Tax=Streptomyces sp. NBC_01373 TaxID=2903843 RepID=UPI002257E229|nr:TIGR03564 family F420-dependent LLM class oxidoreductase [Streptomyces sp. NBC_01373]MCX4704269.1 TIGR03564 family F420-dependent LLM class oxidoreductase [Streptomyces sp. NBC_01373]